MALTVFAALLSFAPSVLAMAVQLAFSPMAARLTWAASPALVLASPLVSAFVQAGVIAAAFQAVSLLIVGRYAEQALGKLCLVLVFVAGAYGGAAARLLLTPSSVVPGLNANGALFATVGAYLMLYGLPGGLPVRFGGSRVAQVAALAGLWALVQLAFMLTARSADMSTQLIEPLGGFAAGVALARPLLAWRYRKA